MYCWFPSILQVLSIIRPETLVRRHWAGFRHYWRWKSRSPGGRPPIEAKLRMLIRSMSIEKPQYKDREDHHDGAKLTEQMLTRLHNQGLILDTAKDEDVGVLYRDWQIPMYNLEFSLIQVPLEELEAEQERELWSMQ
jgi:hypothetical protein